MALYHWQRIFWSCVLSRNGLKFLRDSAILIAGIFWIILLITGAAPHAKAASRIKDIVSVEGIRDNALVGYGLVMGLNGTGDRLNSSAFTKKSLQSYLSRMGISVEGNDLKSKNVAAVTITATLPPFARAGSKIDVIISTMGDAKSLQGGTLIGTPLTGADGKIYAVAQGNIAIGGFEASGGSGSSVSKGVPTGGFIASGAIIEREIDFELNDLKELDLALRNPDIITAGRIASAINTSLRKGIATVRDSGTVSITIPEDYPYTVAGLLSQIEPLEVEPDQVARVIVDEASGTIVMNENVRIDTVAIAQGNLVVRISEDTSVSQPGTLAPEGAETTAVTQSTVDVEEGNSNKMILLEQRANLRDLVDGLNALGIGPRDLINILQAIKVAGALQAEIEMR